MSLRRRPPIADTAVAAGGMLTHEDRLLRFGAELIFPGKAVADAAGA